MKERANRLPKSVRPALRRPNKPIRKVRVTLKPYICDPTAAIGNDTSCLVSPETVRDAPTSGSSLGTDQREHATAEVIAGDCFGLAEIVTPALLRAIDNCADFNGQGFFHNRRENRLAMLVLAYLLLRELVTGGKEAISLAINRFPSDARVRRPSATKPELIAIQLTAKPETEAQRKLCSDYGSVLMVARVKALSPDEFANWIEDADIGDCKAKAKRVRAALKAGLLPEIDDEPDETPPASTDEPWVQISHGRGGQVAGSYSASIPETTLSSVADLIEAGVASGSLSSVLRMIVQALDVAEVTNSLASPARR